MGLGPVPFLPSPPHGRSGHGPADQSGFSGWGWGVLPPICDMAASSGPASPGCGHVWDPCREHRRRSVNPPGSYTVGTAHRGVRLREGQGLGPPPGALGEPGPTALSLAPRRQILGV